MITDILNLTNSTLIPPSIIHEENDYIMDYLDSNCDAYPFEYDDFTQIPTVRYTFYLLYSLIIIFSLIGNLIIITTILRHRHMRTVTNYYILNLALSDIVISALVMPLKALEYLAPCDWMISTDNLCVALTFTLPVFVFSSVLTLIAISVERYYVIVHPINAKMFSSKRRTMRIIIMIWLTAAAVALPFLLARSYVFSMEGRWGSISRNICTDKFNEIDVWIHHVTGNGNTTMADNIVTGRFRSIFFLFLFLSMYVIPSAIILYTCVRIAVCLWKPVAILERTPAQLRAEINKRKIARMVIVVALTFLISWTPFYLVNLISQIGEKNFLQERHFLFTMLSTHLIGFTNSSVNPLVYTILGDRFQASLKQLLAAVCCCLPGSTRRALREQAESRQRRLRLYRSGIRSDVGSVSSTEIRRHGDHRLSMTVIDQQKIALRRESNPNPLNNGSADKHQNAITDYKSQSSPVKILNRNNVNSISTTVSSDQFNKSENLNGSDNRRTQLLRNNFHRQYKNLSWSTGHAPDVLECFELQDLNDTRHVKFGFKRNSVFNIEHLISSRCDIRPAIFVTTSSDIVKECRLENEKLILTSLITSSRNRTGNQSQSETFTSDNVNKSQTDAKNGLSNNQQTKSVISQLSLQTLRRPVLDRKCLHLKRGVGDKGGTRVSGDQSINPETSTSRG